MITIDGIIFSLQNQGGISVYFHKLFDYLVSQSIRPTVIVEGHTKQDVGSGDVNASIIRRRARLLERYRSCRIPSNASVFHSSYYRRPNVAGTPTVVTVHDFVYERYASGPKRWVHLHQKHAAIRAAQAVICVSDSTRQDMLEVVGETPGQMVHVIHNGVSELFHPLPPLPARIPYALYVGERAGYKNFQLIVSAMALLPDMELHCVGGGVFRAEELEAVPAGVRGRIRYLGYVPDEVLNDIYNRAHCLVYPSGYEGFGIPVLEAMRAGCPVVSLQCKAVLEVGGAALTVADGADSRALADAVLSLNSAEYRNRKVLSGLDVSRRFSWRQTHESTLAVYKSLDPNVRSPF